MSKWIGHHGTFSNEIDEISDESFRLFLDVCWPYVDYFTFSSCDDDFVGVELRSIVDFCPLKKELSPWFAGRTVRPEWFGYGWKGSKMCIYRYKSSREAKEVILSCYRDIMLRHPIPKPGINRLRRFDDLCLFSRGKLFYGSICHESVVYLYPLTIQMRSIVTSLGKWWPSRLVVDESSRRNIYKYNWTDEPSPT